MTPETLAAKGTEAGEQMALFCWAALMQGRYPMLKWMFAVKNEERSGSVIAGAKAKAMGVKAGVADIFLPFPCGHNAGLFIEMKKKGGKQSPKQIEFQKELHTAYKYVLCYGWKEAVNEIEKYLQG